MSKIDEMLKNEKVEWMVLGDLGEFYGGLTGKNKNDFTDGNAKYVTYKNVYSNPSTSLDIDDRVKIKEGESQRKLECGDIIFTGSSETADECGLSSVITSEPKEDLYLNSFCFFLRLNDKNLLLPDFAKHLFRSHRVRKQIIMTASGVTRFNVSKQLMGQVEIPVPSIETQEKIVKTLDKFTNYFTELQSELQSRNKQYEYYRDKLLSEEQLNKVLNNYDLYKYKLKETTLGELAKINRGKRLVRDQLSDEGAYPVYQNSLTPLGFYHEKNFEGDKTCVISAGAAADIFYQKKDFWAADDVLVITTDKLISKYIYYYLLSKRYLLKSQVRKASVPRLSREIVENLKIIYPPIEIQEKIVEILDKFQALTQDVSGLLPDEIEKREKQYEYYREKLLTFDTKCTSGGGTTY